MSHAHSHSDSHGHTHSHDTHEYSADAPLPPSPSNYIYTALDLPRIQTLNEATPHSGRAVFEKGWSRHLDAEPELLSAPVPTSSSSSSSSSDDEHENQILLYIPFTAQCRLTHLLVVSPPDATAPQTISLYANPPGERLDFSTAEELKPTQTLRGLQMRGLQELPLMRARWAGVRGVGIWIRDSYGSVGQASGQIRVGFLGFKGEWTLLRREAVHVLYEAAANPRDHAPVVGTGGLGALGRLGGE